MNPSNLAEVVSTGVSLLGLIWLWLWLFPDYFVDRFRQQLFALRDQLFDCAADGVVPFDHKAYGLLRSTMNGLIRFGHKLDIMQVVIFSLTSRSGREFSEDWQQALESLDPDARAKHDEVLRKVHLIVLRHLVMSSPLLWIAVFPLLSGKVAAWFIARLSKGLFVRLDTAALQFGQDLYSARLPGPFVPDSGLV